MYFVRGYVFYFPAFILTDDAAIGQRLERKSGFPRNLSSRLLRSFTSLQIIGGHDGATSECSNFCSEL